MRNLLLKTMLGTVLAGTVFLAGGCDFLGGHGEVRFRAATAIPSASPGTKTAYSGEVTNNTERIDWVSGDRFRLASDLARTSDGTSDYADYAIDAASIEASGRFSTAKVGAVGGHGLYWGDGLHRFWGVYPPNAITVSSGSASAAGLSIPATQNVDPTDTDRKVETTTSTTFVPSLGEAWMVADKAGVSESASGFTMDFYPAFTAFEFTLHSKEDATLTVKSFTLSSASTDLAGTFDATSIVDGGASTFGNVASGSRTIQVGFGTSGVEVTQTKSLTFTVLALPQVLEDVTIAFTLEKGGIQMTRSLDLKYSATAGGDFISFAACSKHKITGLALPSGDLVLSSVTVRAWDQSTSSAVDYSYEYTSPAAAKIKSLDKYRRYDSDGDYSTWEGSYILVSYGYMNHEGDIVITDDPDTDLRSAFSPAIELATESQSNTVLRLVLDNPNFKFVQYTDNAAAESDHSVTDAIEIPSGPNVQTFFSVVPVKQFRIDAPESEKICTVSLLSVESGTFHEMSFNNSGTSDYHRLPGESSTSLSFYYAGPAVYDGTGVEYNPDGTAN